MESILVSFLYLLLYIAIIIFVAFVIVWVLREVLGTAIDANVYKWGKVIVGLLCCIAIVVWVFSIIPGSGVHFGFRLAP